MFTLIFIAVTILSLLLVYYGTGKDKRFLGVSIAWLFVMGAVSYTGYFENTRILPPRFLFAVAGAIILSVYFYRRLQRNNTSTVFLVAVHTLRLPVELSLYHLFLQKKVPEIMTFKGWNFDIVMGISAVFILLYLLGTRKKLDRYFFLFWNIAGLIFLAVIVVMGVLSSPLPFQQFAFHQPNIAVLQFPFSYLPAVIVPMVALSHSLSIGTCLPSANAHKQ